MLNKLRSKPEHIKKSIALTLTVVIFSGIVFVWLSSWDARMNGRDAQGKALSPAAGLKELFQGAVSDAEKGLTSVPSYVKNTNTATTVATSSIGNTFDISGVVVIDATTSSMAGK